MMKILLSAYACEPHRGSEPGVGWNWALQAAKSHEVWVLTRASNRQPIELELLARPNPNLHFIYHDLPQWARRWKRGKRGVHLYYYLWQLTAIPLVRAEHARVKFDVGHHITLVSFRHPSVLAWSAIPYIWGPVAGNEEAPRSFYSVYGSYGAIQQLLRRVSNAAVAVDPFVFLTRKRASIILSATPETSRALAGSEIFPAIGLSTEDFAPMKANPHQGPLRLLYVGNLLYWKGVQLAIHAVALAHRQGTECTLTIVGDGPYRSRLETLVQEQEIADLVIFKGRLDRATVFKCYEDHDVFLFPSLRDSGAFVVQEAMANGLPVICIGIGGPNISVTDETGFRIVAASPGQTVHDLAVAISWMSAEPERRRRMGLAGRRRAQEEFSWSRKAEFVSHIYKEISKGEVS